MDSVFGQHFFNLCECPEVKILSKCGQNVLWHYKHAWVRDIHGSKRYTYSAHIPLN